MQLVDDVLLYGDLTQDELDQSLARHEANIAVGFDDGL